MRSYIKQEDKVLMLGRLLNAETVQMIDDTEVIQIKIRPTNLIGDILVIGEIREDKQYIDTKAIYSIGEYAESKYVIKENWEIFIIPTKDISSCRIKTDGNLLLNTKIGEQNYYLEVINPPRAKETRAYPVYQVKEKRTDIFLNDIVYQVIQII